MGSGFSNSNSDSQCEWSWTVDWSVEIIIKHPRRIVVCLFLEKKCWHKIVLFLYPKSNPFHGPSRWKIYIAKNTGRGIFRKVRRTFGECNRVE